MNDSGLASSAILHWLRDPEHLPGGTGLLSAKPLALLSLG